MVVFCDGLGVGSRDPSDNAFASGPWRHLDRLSGTSFLDLDARMGARAINEVEDAAVHVVGAIDATLGVPGRPQSATGQAALVTGRNAAATMNGHYGPWPGPTLRRLLDEGTIFHDVVSRCGASIGGLAWATAYPAAFFDALRRGRMRTSSLLHAALAAGCTLPEDTAVASGRAAPADFAGIGIDPRSLATDVTDRAGALGRTLVEFAADHVLTWFDAWTTDAVGHRADLDQARQIVTRLDAFIGGVLEARTVDTTVILVSDHGNLESAASKHHTRSRVPLLVLGPAAGAFHGVDDLMGFATSVRALLRSTQ